MMAQLRNKLPVSIRLYSAPETARPQLLSRDVIAEYEKEFHEGQMSEEALTAPKSNRVEQAVQRPNERIWNRLRLWEAGKPALVCDPPEQADRSP